jgi:hypothetical protein
VGSKEQRGDQRSNFWFPVRGHNGMVRFGDLEGPSGVEVGLWGGFSRQTPPAASSIAKARHEEESRGPTLVLEKGSHS